MGLLGAQGQGDLLLRWPGRAGVHDGVGPVLPTVAAHPRRRGVPCDGRGRRRYPAPPVLVRRRRLRVGRRGAPAPACTGLASLAAARARARRAAVRRAPACSAGRHPRGRLRRHCRALARALAPRPRRLACRRGGDPPRWRGQHQA